MDEYNEDNSLLHYDKMYTICQETDCDYSGCRSVRGYDSARSYNLDCATNTYTHIAFRPALEDLNHDQENTEK